MLLQGELVVERNIDKLKQATTLPMYCAPSVCASLS